MSLSISDLRLQVKDRSVLNKRTVTSYRRVGVGACRVGG